MWYLIVPPLVFLGSLWLLLLFLSRRTADPTLQEKLENELNPPTRRILFIKEETGLRILEKVTQRFKVMSLKMHNSFNSLSQSIKERRAVFTKRAEEKRAMVPDEAGDLTPPGMKQSPWKRFGRGNAASIRVSGGDEPLDGEGASPAKPSMENEERSFEPAKSFGDSIARGTGMLLRRRRENNGKPKRLVSEEDLIAKIAKNPKDAIAYEELGDYYMETDTLEDAKACYRQVIKLSPLNREVKDKVRKLERLLTQRGR
ncbi:MAG: hypothetical protein ABI747_02120 [Candidatus Moraniibacteriota bacterium]